MIRSGSGKARFPVSISMDVVTRSALTAVAKEHEVSRSALCTAAIRAVLNDPVILAYALTTVDGYRSRSPAQANRNSGIGQPEDDAQLQQEQEPEHE